MDEGATVVRRQRLEQTLHGTVQASLIMLVNFLS